MFDFVALFKNNWKQNIYVKEFCMRDDFRCIIYKLSVQFWCNFQLNSDHSVLMGRMHW